MFKEIKMLIFFLRKCFLPEKDFVTTKFFSDLRPDCTYVKEMFKPLHAAVNLCRFLVLSPAQRQMILFSRGKSVGWQKYRRFRLSEHKNYLQFDLDS